MKPAEIRARRRRIARVLVISSTFTSTLFFACFTFGAAMGPAPLSAPEIVVGSVFSFLIGIFVSLLSVRRRLEADAELVLSLRERRRGRRLAIYEDYFTIDKLVIPKEALRTAKLDDDLLELVYFDADAPQPVSRYLSGRRETLYRARAALVRA